MTKKFVNLGLIYAIAAMVFGVFYREFTKLQDFSGDTRLSVLHTHYFMLGMFFFLVLAALEKTLKFMDGKTGVVCVIYQVGLNITGLAFLVRGIMQVLVQDPSRGLDASISGIAGIGHIIMSVCMIIILIKIRKAAKE